MTHTSSSLGFCWNSVSVVGTATISWLLIGKGTWLESRWSVTRSVLHVGLILLFYNGFILGEYSDTWLIEVSWGLKHWIAHEGFCSLLNLRSVALSSGINLLIKFNVIWTLVKFWKFVVIINCLDVLINLVPLTQNRLYFFDLFFILFLFQQKTTSNIVFQVIASFFVFPPLHYWTNTRFHETQFLKDLLQNKHISSINYS